MRAAGAALALGLLTAPLVAQAQTMITPDVGALGLGTTATRAGAVVTIDGGALAGGNLFHSFATFSLSAGDTARWTRAAGGAADVRNIVNRVTGGQASTIAGEIDATAFPNAAFFFVNPAGVVFAAGARINVPAAAYFTSASALRFADGASFSMATPGGSTLTLAAPDSFGFVGGEGAVSVAGAGLAFAPAATRLSLVGASVSVAGSQFGAGGLDLVSAGSGAATVRLTDPLAGGPLGAVTVAASQLGVSTAGGTHGALRIGGGSVTLDGAVMAAYTPNAIPGPDATIAAGQLTLRNGSLVGVSTSAGAAGGRLAVIANSVEGDGGGLYTLAQGDGAGGAVSVAADTINLRGGFTVSSNTTGPGAGGRIDISARSSYAADAAYVTAGTLGAGAGGAISLTAPAIDLSAALVVSTGNAAGRPGDVTLTGGTIVASAGLLGSAPGATSDTGNLTVTATKSFSADGVIMTASAYSDGAAGVISLSAPQITLRSGFIDTNSYGAGGVGRVLIAGQSLVLDGTQITSESRGQYTGQLGVIQLKASGPVRISGGYITSNAYGPSRGGAITIEGADLVLDDAQITADSIGEAMGGQVSIVADSLKISSGSISTNAQLDGPAGDVSLKVRTSLTLDQSASISSDALDSGNAGAVAIQAGAIRLSDGATISSIAHGGTGAAGAVSTVSDSLTMTDATILSDTDGAGRGGTVTVKTGTLEMAGVNRPLTYISSDALGSGDAGDVTITADQIDIHDQAYVSSNSLSDANAGRVAIKAGVMRLRGGSFVSSDSSLGAGRAGDVAVTADTLTIDGAGDVPAEISSDSLANGDAGDVQVTAKSLNLDNGGLISSSTFLFGRAGDVAVTGGAVTLDHGSAIASAAFPGSAGDAGQVSIVADSLKVGENASVTTSSAGAGDAGALILKLRSLDVEAGDVSSAAVLAGRGATGTLAIEADSLRVAGGGRISTLSNNPHPAGRIRITAGAVTVSGAGSQIASENQAGNPKFDSHPRESGDAGSIALTARRVTVADGAGISTDSFAGAAGDIAINIAHPGLLVLQGASAPGAIQTSSGPGTGGRISISDPLAVVSNGGTIRALGEQRGANVAIQADYFINSSDRSNVIAVAGEFRLVAGVYDVSAGAVARDLSVLDASKVLRGQCPVTRATGQVSQLITRQVGPYVREPVLESVPPPAAAKPDAIVGCR